MRHETREPRLNTVRLLAASSALAACFAAGCTSTPAPQPVAVTADTWAIVDGRTISREDVERAFRRLGDRPEGLSDEEALTTKLNVLNDLIVEDLLLAKARGLKLDVLQSELDAAFADARKNIPDEAFQQELTRRNLTADQMRDGLRRELLTSKLLNQEVGSKVTVTDSDVAAYFNGHRDQFNLPENAYRLAQIVVTPVQDGQLANRTGDDATTPQAAAAKVQMLMQRLKEGATFTDVARDFSEDPESAQRGGDLGLVPLSALRQAPPPLRDAVLNANPGTAKVVNQNGLLTIVYVVAREQAGQRELSTPGVKEQITQGLRARQEQLLRTAYLAAVHNDAVVVNHLARRVVEARGKVPSLGLATPATR